jgi:hypothetical protein
VGEITKAVPAGDKLASMRINTEFINLGEAKTKHKNSVVKSNSQKQHHRTITHLVLDLLHRLELFYGKQQTRICEMR